MDIVDLPDDGSREREVIAYYGSAMFYAQIFERGMINLLLMLELSPLHNTREDYDSLARLLDKKTAGSLIKRLRTSMNVDDSTQQMLEKALETRNHLAHSFSTRTQWRLHFQADNNRCLISVTMRASIS